MAIFVPATIIGRPVSTGVQIARSLRFRSVNSTYLTRTFAAAPTTRTKLHYHAWIKRGILGTQQNFFEGYDGASSVQSAFLFNANNELVLQFGGAASTPIITVPLFRDPGAWYCIDLAIDTTQATAANRVLMWVNGVQLTGFTATYPAQNALHQFLLNNSNNRIGINWNATLVPFDGYMADVHVIDGTPKTAADFGQFDINGIWQPKPYTGAYGTNGFRLNFSDASAATAAALGADSSGNGNNWTPNHTVTAGALNDSLTDTPTNYGVDAGVGGVVRGNYAVLNPLDAGTLVVRSGGLELVASVASAWHSVRSTFAVPVSGDWWCEVDLISVGTGTGDIMLGVADFEAARPAYPGAAATANSWGYQSSGSRYNNGTGAVWAATYAGGDKIAIRVAAGAVYFYKLVTGAWVLQGGGAAAGVLISGSSVAFTFAMYNGTATNNLWVNFGQRPWAATPPAGTKAVCAQNLPAPAFALPTAGFDIKTYSGTGANQNITGVGHAPDLLWLKVRGTAADHILDDTVRGAGYNLRSNVVNAETYGSPSNDGITSFNSDGFSLGANNNGGTGYVNVAATTYVAWMWKKGVTPGLDIVQYTGNGVARTIPHSLGAVPALIICKYRASGTYNWVLQHWRQAPNPANSYLTFTSNANTADTTVWNGVPPTSSVFSVGTNAGPNANGGNYIAWLFAEVPGFSKFGVWTGNNSTNGPFAYCGFKPRYLMFKRIDVTGNWIIIDTTRWGAGVWPSNPVNMFLIADTTQTDTSNGMFFDFLSNGFKVRVDATFPGVNTAGGIYIFAAFAEHPFNTARAR